MWLNVQKDNYENSGGILDEKQNIISLDEQERENETRREIQKKIVEQKRKDKNTIEHLMLRLTWVDLSLPPKILSTEQQKIMREDLSWEHSFAFGFDNKQYFLWYYDWEPFVRVTINGELPPDLNKEQRSKFKKITKDWKLQYVQDFWTVPWASKGKEQFYTVGEWRRDFSDQAVLSFFMNASKTEFSLLLDKFMIGWLKKEEALKYFSDKEFNLLKTVFSKKEREEIFSYLRRINLPTPIQRSPAKLAEKIKGKKILFYSWAWISIASNIPDMKTLESNLWVDGSILRDKFFDKFIDDPKKAFEARAQFTYNSRYGEPTKAHFAMKELSEKLSCQIFTENIDFLHTNTWIQEHHVSWPRLRENISEDQMKNIDFVITVWLSADDRWMLQWYKKINPKGKIIALNLEQPNYIGEKDVLVKWDIQKTLLEINNIIQSN